MQLQGAKAKCKMQKTKSFRLKIETKAKIFRGTTQIAQNAPLGLITAADRSLLQHRNVLRKDCSEVSKNKAPNVSHRPTSLFARAKIPCPLQRISKKSKTTLIIIMYKTDFVKCF